MSVLVWGLALTNKKQMLNEVLSHLDAALTSLSTVNLIRVESILRLSRNIGTYRLSLWHAAWYAIGRSEVSMRHLPLCKTSGRLCLTCLESSRRTHICIQRRITVVSILQGAGR